MGKYGTNLTGIGAYEGGVNNDKGSPLVANNSDGETALLFGPAALREIQTGVANGDFAIPPDQSTDTITEENPLPYWTVTTVGSTCTAAMVVDTDAASGQSLQITVGAGSGGSLTLSRYIPIPGTRGQTFCVAPILTMGSASNVSDAELYAIGRQYDNAGNIVGSTITLPTYQFNSYTGVVENLLPDVDAFADWKYTAVQPNAAFFKISITFQNAGTTAASRTIKVFDVRLLLGSSDLTIAESTTPGTYGPAYIRQENGSLNITANSSAAALEGLAVTTAGITVTGSTKVTGSIGMDGSLYGSSALTGPRIVLGGTNTRLWQHANPACDVAASTSSVLSGVLITKQVLGQPTTTINGTGTTDAFADALRGGAIAVDATNNRAYFYSGGWKFAALTTPSDSRLKEEITEITGALDTLRQLVPVAFKWKAPEAHGRTDAVADDGKRLGFIADQVATTDLAHWVETLGVDDREAHLVDTTEVLAVNIPQNEMEALVVQALLDIDTRLKALESR
jgi:hypothetical protein